MKNKIQLLSMVIALMVLSSFATVEPTKVTSVEILLILSGIWEVVGRIIPSVGQITIIGKVLEILTFISNLLNRKKT